MYLIFWCPCQEDPKNKTLEIPAFILYCSCIILANVILYCSDEKGVTGMNEFKEFLKEHRVKEKYIPHYVRWITRCYAFLGEEFSARLDGSQKERFLKHIAGQFEEWQVKQADYAIKLYQYFLSSKEKADNVQTSSPEAWDWLQEEA